MNSILKHALGLTASIALFAPTIVDAAPLASLKFAAGSYCGAVATRTHWTTVKANKGQQMTIVMPMSYDETVVVRLTNVTTGKTFKVTGNYDFENNTIVSETFTLKSTGSYVVKTYNAETMEEVGNGSIGICII